MATYFNAGQLTKEMVAARLKAMADPCAAAADIVLKTLQVGLKDTPADQRLPLIREVCYGMMTAILLAEQSLPKGATQLLQKAGEAAAGAGLDPTEAMTAALAGIADISHVVKEAQLHEIRIALDTALNGTGEVYARLLREKAGAADPGKIKS